MNKHGNTGKQNALKDESERKDSKLVVRVKQSDKAAWVRAANKGKLADWVIDTLNRASETCINEGKKMSIDYDSFVDSLDDRWEDDRTAVQIKENNEESARLRKKSIIAALKRGEKIEEEKFNNGTIDVTHYKLKIVGINSVFLSKEDAEYYAALKL